MTHTQLLASALQTKEMPDPDPCDTVCAVSGERIKQGYRCMDKRVLPAALNDFASLFGSDTNGWMSESAARCLTGDWNLGSRIIFADGAHYHLLTNREQAEKQDRPYWSKIVRDIYPIRAGQECLMILTTDVKKRCWQRSRAGRLGSHTPIMIHASEYNMSGTVYVDWGCLLSTLDAIESAYNAGFSKDGIMESLYGEFNKMAAYGAIPTRALETSLAPLRRLPEFVPALIMAQKSPTL